MTTTPQGLAAVHEAAGSISRADHDAALATARSEADAAGFTRGRTEGLAAGAIAERERLMAIDAIAKPGFEKLIAECKADPKCTPGDAALRLIAAEKEQLANHHQAIQDVEKVTGKVPATPTSAPTGSSTTTSQTADGWKAEWARTAALQSDFASADAYANYMQGVKDGRIRVLKAPASAA